MSRLRFGVVGCGAIVTLHQLPALRRCAALDVVAVTDRDATWATSVAGRFGVPTAFDDHRRLEGAVDAALIATPNSTHAAIACDLLERGIHVLCEKPLTVTSTEAQDLVKLAEEKESLLMMASKFRYVTDVVQAKSIVSSGLIGDIVLFENAFTSRVDMTHR